MRMPARPLGQPAADWPRLVGWRSSRSAPPRPPLARHRQTPCRSRTEFGTTMRIYDVAHFTVRTLERLPVDGNQRSAGAPTDLAVPGLYITRVSGARELAGGDTLHAFT